MTNHLLNGLKLNCLLETSRSRANGCRLSEVVYYDTTADGKRAVQVTKFDLDGGCLGTDFLDFDAACRDCTDLLAAGMALDV